jgi:serralysin
MARSAHLGVVLAVTVGAVAVAAPARAATPGSASLFSASQVQFQAGTTTGGDGRDNRLVITRAGRTVTVADKFRIKPGRGCENVPGDRTRVRCTLRNAPTGMFVYAGDGDDVVINRTGIPSMIDGGAGNDRLTGGSGADFIGGGAGNDRIRGGAGDDDLLGGDGDDRLRGQAGDDRLTGQDGRNRLDGGRDGDTCAAGPLDAVTRCEN